MTATGRFERILNFHGIGAPSRPFDPGEAPYWISRDAFAAILGMIAGRPDRARIGLTFDDGNESDVEIALPLLRQARARATFFLLAGRLDKPGFVDRAGVRALREGGMAIGSHGWSHVDWRSLDEAGRRREFVEARAMVADAAGAPVSEAAVPFGAYDRKVLRALLRADYAAIYTSDGGAAGGGPVFARTSIRSDMTVRDVEAVLDGREPLLRRLRRAAAVLRKRIA